MPNPQKAQEKEAWNTPTLMVLTRPTDSEPSVLAACKTSKMFHKPENYHGNCMDSVQKKSCTACVIAAIG